MQCRSHAAQLGRLHEEFRVHNCEIVLILGDNVEKAKRYVDSLHLPFPVLSDPERSVYHQYGLEKAMIFIQRTASIVVDPCGTIQYLKTTTSPNLWMKESKEVLNFVQSTVMAC